MGDPISGAVGLIAAIVQLSSQITAFVRGVRDARQDMDFVSRELSSLKLCLETLHEDCSHSEIQYPLKAKQMLMSIMSECGLDIQRMHERLAHVSSDSLGDRVRWSTSVGSDVDKLRLRIASHKALIDLWLEMVSLSLISATKEDTAIIRQDTGMIRQDTARIPQIQQDTTALRHEIAQMRSQIRNSNSVALERILDQSEQYAESIAQSVDTALVTKRTPSPLGPTHELPDAHLSEQTMVNEALTEDLAKDSPGLEVVNASNVSTIPARTDAPVPLAYRAPIHRRSSVGELDEIAMRASAEARSRLSDTDRNNFDRGLLKLVKFPTKADVAKIRSMLDSGANPDAAGPRNTVLTTELQYGKRADVVELLLRRGCNPNATTDKGGIPAYEILEGGNMERMKSLVRKGASIDAVPNRVGALYLAAVHCDEGVVQLLLQYNVSVNPELEYDRPLRRFSTTTVEAEVASTARDRNTSFTVYNGQHRSALLAAADSRKWPMVYMLMDAGCNVNAKGGVYGTALQAAVYAKMEDLVERLIEKGADVNARGGFYDTALIAAAYEGHRRITRLLVQKGSNLNTPGLRCGTALTAAASRGNLDVVIILLENRADPNLIGALDVALAEARKDPSRNRTAIVRALEAAGARQQNEPSKVVEHPGLF